MGGEAGGPDPMESYRERKIKRKYENRYQRWFWLTWGFQVFFMIMHNLFPDNSPGYYIFLGLHWVSIVIVVIILVFDFRAMRRRSRNFNAMWEEEMELMKGPWDEDTVEKLKAVRKKYETEI
jgi:hypothetical protein